jgi:hypothetical protein
MKLSNRDMRELKKKFPEAFAQAKPRPQIVVTSETKAARSKPIPYGRHIVIKNGVVLDG